MGTTKQPISGCVTSFRRLIALVIMTIGIGSRKRELSVRLTRRARLVSLVTGRTSSAG